MLTDIVISHVQISMLTGSPEGLIQAMQYFEQAYQLSPSNYNALINFAYMKFRFAANSMQTIESSRQLFNEAISKFPKQAEVFVLYGQVCSLCVVYS